MNSIQGDLLQLAILGYFDVVVRGRNCFCEMNRGIAKSIQKHFLEAYSAAFVNFSLKLALSATGPMI